MRVSRILLLVLWGGFTCIANAMDLDLVNTSDYSLHGRIESKNSQNEAWVAPYEDISFEIRPGEKKSYTLEGDSKWKVSFAKFTQQEIFMTRHDQEMSLVANIGQTVLGISALYLNPIVGAPLAAKVFGIAASAPGNVLRCSQIDACFPSSNCVDSLQNWVDTVYTISEKIKTDGVWYKGGQYMCKDLPNFRGFRITVSNLEDSPGIQGAIALTFKEKEGGIKVKNNLPPLAAIPKAPGFVPQPSPAPEPTLVPNPTPKKKEVSPGFFQPIPGDRGWDLFNDPVVQDVLQGRQVTRERFENSILNVNKPDPASVPTLKAKCPPFIMLTAEQVAALRARKKAKWLKEAKEKEAKEKEEQERKNKPCLSLQSCEIL